ncbi:lysozyme inhibitor LprI family protein [Brevundimonas sp. FT23028]|uniref:lysozyme inhibitor LprI family protein n=1 Tax=Brevundimonas sp. FT23028 TaxID=3393748 RepID=UPI003B58B0FD
MKIAVTLLLGAAMAGTPGAASAQDRPAPRPAFDACMQRASGVTVDVRACISAEHSRQDALLNTRYRELMQRLPPERQAALRAAQRAWIAFREADCSYSASRDAGGTLEAVMIDSCWMEFTTRRATSLGADLEFERKYGG